MVLDPTNVSPSADTGGPYGRVATSLLRPRAFNCLAGTKPAIPSFTPSTYQAQRTYTQGVIAQNTPPGSLVHIGDSLTECFDVQNVSPYGVNFGIGEDTAEAILYRLSLANYVPVLTRARAVSLMVGINNLRSGGAAANAQDMLNRLVNWFSGPLIWTKIAYMAAPQNVAYNANIQTVNSYITTQLASRAQTAIVDINPIIAPGGTLLPAYDFGDGLHWNAAAYLVWADAQRAALASLS